MNAPVTFAGRAPRSLARAMWRGFNCRCPNCGQGKMFRAYLKVIDRCTVCGAELFHQRADDAPPYFVILITGHIIVPTALIVETEFSPPFWLHAIIWGPLTAALALALLQPIKGAIVGWQWANYMHGFDPNFREEDEGLAAGDRDA